MSIITIGVVLSALGYNLIFEPMFKKWAALNNNIVIKRTTLRKNQRLLRGRNRIIREYNSYAASIRGMSKILSYIEQHADSSGIQTSNIKPLPVIKKKLYKEYIIEIRLEGTFPDIIKFISDIIDGRGAIVVKKFDIRAAKSPAANLASFKCTLVLSKLII